jgi:hypothetical protein
MFDIRFNKGKGKYFRHWRIKDLINKTVEYCNPEFFTIQMYDCVLTNNKGTAEKVFATQRRDVCGFVRCKKFKILQKCAIQTDCLGELLYDPKVTPFWRKNNEENSFDNSKYKELITKGRRIFIVES